MHLLHRLWQELFYCIQGLCGVHRDRPSTHQKRYCDRLQQLLACGASRDCIVDMVGDAAFAVDNDTDRQRHQFLGFRAQNTLFHSFFMQARKTGHWTRHLSPKLR